MRNVVFFIVLYVLLTPPPMCADNTTKNGNSSNRSLSYSLWSCAVWCGFGALREIKRQQIHREFDNKGIKKPFFSRTALSYMKSTWKHMDKNNEIQTLNGIANNARSIIQAYTDFGLVKMLPADQAVDELSKQRGLLINSIKNMKYENNKLNKEHKNRIAMTIGYLHEHISSSNHNCYEQDSSVPTGRILLYGCRKLPQYAQAVIDACAFSSDEITQRNRAKNEALKKEKEELLACITTNESNLKRHTQAFDRNKLSLWTPQALGLCAASIACTVGGLWTWVKGN